MRANEALRDARAELAELAVAEERLRFSRDLHDLLGHDLSLIALKAELAGQAAARARRPGRDRGRASIRELDPQRARRRCARRSAATAGRRSPSELAGAKVALEAAGIELQRAAGPNGPLDPEVESVLAWAVREGATNAIRHSGARRAAITVRPRTRDDRARRSPTTGAARRGAPTSAATG